MVRDGRIVDVRPFARDFAPSPIINGTAEAVHAANRVDRPYVRKGWLDGDRLGGTLRGNEPFVPVDWDTAVTLVAQELARVRQVHGAASVFGGSYGWASAGRFHHAKTQMQRMLAATGGFTDALTSYSIGAAQTLLPHIVGGTESVAGPLVDWRAIAQHAKLMLCFGGIAVRNGQMINGGGAVHDMGHWLRHAAHGRRAASEYLAAALRHRGRHRVRVAADSPRHRHRADVGDGVRAGRRGPRGS